MDRSRKQKLSQSQISSNSFKELEVKKQNMYFITHYVTPKKKLVRLKPHAIQKVTSVTNLRCISSREQTLNTSTRCKKSLSLQDLSPGFQKHLNKRRSLLCSKRIPAALTMEEASEILDEKTRAIASKVIYMFVRNAWRKLKEDTEIKEVYMKSTLSHVSNLKLQVTTMKSLLKSDEQVISNSFKEIQSLKTLLNTLQDQHSSIKSEKENIEKTLHSTKEELDAAKTESLNDKNALILCKSEATALEAQLHKEREKIAKLKSENRTLLDKVDDLTVCNKIKAEDIKDLNETLEKMQQQQNTHLNLLKTAEQKILQQERIVEETSGCVKSLKKELGDIVRREGKLKVQVEDSKKKLEEQRRHFDEVIKEKTMKIVELAIAQAMNSAVPLKIRLLRYASYVVTEAMVILQAFSSG